MKNLVLSVLLLALFVSPVLAHEGEEHDATIEEVEQDILASQGLKDLNEVNCEDVLEIQFEELGDAVMGLMHPDEEEHSFMDQMMGGEDSESLEESHLVMGQRYLGCDSGDVVYPLDRNFGGMMGWYGSSDSGNTVLIMGSLLGILGITALGFSFYTISKRK